MKMSLSRLAEEFVKRPPPQTHRLLLCGDKTVLASSGYGDTYLILHQRYFGTTYLSGVGVDSEASG